MSNFQLYKKAISATGTTTENEPIIKSDGASSNVMQWLSNNEASNITISEDGSNNLDLVVSSGTVTATALDGTLGATTPASVVATTVTTSNTVASPVTLSRIGSAVNASITYTTTGGSIYAGYGSAGLFAVNDSVDLTSTPAFTVNAATGATTTAGLATFSNGIAFQSATTGTGTGTGYTLDSYEVGTFTPVDSSGASLAFTSASGFYTKIGSLVTFRCTFTFPTTTDTSNVLIGGLPFSVDADTGGATIGYTPAASSAVAYTTIAATNIYLLRPGVNTTNANMSTQSIVIYGTYNA